MDPLVSALVSMRRKAREAVAVAGIILLAAVVFLDAMLPLDAVIFVPFALLLLGLICVRGWQRTRSVRQKAWLDAEFGVLLIVAAFAVVVHHDGSLEGEAYPLVYLAVGIVSAFARPAASLAAIAVAIGFELGLRGAAYGGVELRAVLPHAAFALAIGLVNMASLRIEIVRLRQAWRRQLDQEQERVRDEARSYRLLRVPRSVAGESLLEAEHHDEQRLLRSGIEEIHESVLFSLQLLRESLRVHTAMLLWLEDGGAQLRIRELATDDGDLREGPFAAGDGLLGAVITQRAAVCVADVKPRFALPYYRGRLPVQAVCVAPVFEHSALRGLLVVDRVRPDPFTSAEQALVEQAARFAARAIQNERVFVQLERTKVDQGKLYRAAEALNEAITEQDVVDAAVTSAREIAAVDFAAFTLFHEATQLHQIRAVSGEQAEQLVGQRFKHTTGLVPMVVRNRHPLPYRGEYDPDRQVVFSKSLQPPADLPSLVVVPLIVHDQPLGTLVLGSRQASVFSEAARVMLEGLASHVAVSLSNARMVRKLEEQATTDGLTGLLNKRTLLTTAEQKLRAAKRFGRRLSVLITDIDHFKNVNDTYGHDVGDVVIKELAAIHERAKRETDAVGRFGGEEFVVICEETDSDGAGLLAERIRVEFSKTTFHASGEEMHCNCSVGIATFPDAGTTWDELFRAADGALYVSKRSGRNRVTIWNSRSGGGHAAA